MDRKKKKEKEKFYKIFQEIFFLEPHHPKKNFPQKVQTTSFLGLSKIIDLADVNLFNMKEFQNSERGRDFITYENFKLASLAKDS